MNFKQEFLNKYGIDLNNVLPNGNDEQNKVDRFVRQQQELLIAYCKSFNCLFDVANLSATKKDKFDQITLTQMWYALNTEDYTAFSGVDIVNNVVMPIADLTDRFIAPLAKLELKNNGFCYRGL